MEKITINDVARQAGVSKKTVSRVLNNEPNVSAVTKAKVDKAVAELGYQPNPLARGLASNQSFILGLLYDNPSKSYITRIQDGALSICQQNGYNLLIHPCVARGKAMLESLDHLIRQSRLDGLVLTPPFSDMEELLEYLEQKKITYVRVGPTAAAGGSLTQISHAPCVMSNDQEATREMTRYLVSLGHRRIAFIKGHPDHNASAERYQGYLQAMADSELNVEPEWVAQGLFTFLSGEECARKLLALEPRPTAVFASNDYMAAGTMKVASQMGITVPQELSVVGFDNAPVSRYIWPSLTTIRQPVQDMARQAVSLLIALLRKQNISDMPTVLESSLMIRESSGPFRQK